MSGPGVAWQYRRAEGQEMARILVRGGYGAAETECLQAEGMGPEELRYRLAVPPPAVGSLLYTHGLQLSR